MEIKAVDSITVYNVSDGQKGETGQGAIYAVLSNENVTVPCNNSGDPSSLGNTSTDIYVYEGTETIPFIGDGSTGFSFYPAWRATITSTGCTTDEMPEQGDYATLLPVSSMSADNATRTIYIEGLDSNEVSFDRTIVQTLSKAKSGGNGSTGNYTKSISLYYIGTSTPAKPTSRVTSTATCTGNTWTQGKYTSFELGKNYYTCIQTETYNSSGVYQSSAWSNVITDSEYYNAGYAKLASNGQYIGIKTSTPTGYSSTSNFDWFLANYSASATSTAAAITKGNVYIWNGVTWVSDTNVSHIFSTLNDQLIVYKTEDAIADGVFVKSFTENLTAMNAFIKNLSVKNLKSENYSDTPGSEKGFFFDGDNGVEYHYNDAVYSNNYIKNSENNLCIALGKNAGFKTPLKGNWKTGVNYKYLDIVSYNSNYYICHQPHTSSNSILPTNTSYWLNLSNFECDSIAIGENALNSSYKLVQSVAIGNDTLKSNTTGSDNVACGYHSMVYNTTGSKNIAIGTSALALNNNSHNTAIGYAAGASNTGSKNIAIGNYSLTKNKGMENIAIGVESLNALNTSKSEDNIGIGYRALYSMTDGTSNIGIGTNALKNATSGCLNNVAIGTNAFLYAGEECFNNIAIGTNSGLDFAANEQGSIDIGGKFQYTKADGIKLNGTKFFDLVYPIGSLYWTESSTFNPSTSFGGTWVKIQGRTIITAGIGTDTNGNSMSFTAGATGGKYKVGLTSSNLPAHSHTVDSKGSHSHTRGTMNIKGFFGDLDRWRSALNNSTMLSKLGLSQNAFYIDSTALNGDGKSGSSGNTQSCVFDASRTWSGSTSSDGSHSHTVNGGGNSKTTGDSFDILPPYEVAYCWKRTA